MHPTIARHGDIDSSQMGGARTRDTTDGQTLATGDMFIRRGGGMHDSPVIRHEISRQPHVDWVCAKRRGIPPVRMRSLIHVERREGGGGQGNHLHACSVCWLHTCAGIMGVVATFCSSLPGCGDVFAGQVPVRLRGSDWGERDGVLRGKVFISDIDGS
jgi:hypothetical protein